MKSMEIVYEKDESGNSVPRILVVVHNKFTKKDLKYKFKEFTVGELKATKLAPAQPGEESTAARLIVPTVYIINAMMIEGERITDATPGHILNQLKAELRDFL